MRGKPSHSDFWAKLSYLDPDDRKVIVAWHPLLSHCADVAACAEALLQNTILSQRFATLLGVDKLHPTHISRLSILIAFHDFGKANHGFQDRAHVGGAPRAGHLSPAIALFREESDWVEVLLEALLVFDMSEWFEDPHDILLIFHNTLCHHGTPIGFDGPPSRRHWEANKRRDPHAALVELGEAVRAWFPEAFDTHAPLFSCTPRFEHAFNGLVTLADWLGSDARSGMFVFDETPGRERIHISRKIASRALEEMHVHPGRARLALGQNPLLFDALFGFPLYPMQANVASLPVPETSSLTLLESDTGSGKTEAAFAHFLRLFQAGLVDGLYFALPTRAAALGLHKRLVKYVSKVWAQDPPPVTLAVPGYIRVDDQDAKARLPHFHVLWDEEAFGGPQERNARYRTWASEHSKRYLLGAIAVGTIDQVLLSGLRTRHAHMRSTALLRHLLVVDEIHASDAYMTRILQQVLDQHIHAGGHAFLMSATLGAHARAHLMSPLRKTQSIGSLEQESQQPYPAVWSSTGVQRVMELVGSPQASGYEKEVEVVLEPWSPTPDRIVACALEAARGGARVLILRNTVRACMETQRLLEEVAPASMLFCPVKDTPTPHHSRFVPEDRRLLDAAIEAVVGRDAPLREEGLIIVATQTVEQSLDIDVDLLLTDLCPMDVLLQRIGRLHRHADRTHPSGFERARAIVLTPESRDLSCYLTPQPNSHGIGTVYENVVILEATWRQLCANNTLTLPRDNRRLVEACVHPEALNLVVDSLGAQWLSHQDLVGAHAALHSRLATDALIPFESRYNPDTFSFPDRQEERIPTRLGADDRRWVLSEPRTSPLGQAFRALCLPWHMCRDIADDAELVFLSCTPDQLVFSVGPQTFVYDRLGIRPQDAS